MPDGDLGAGCFSLLGGLGANLQEWQKGESMKTVYELQQTMVSLSKRQLFPSR